jgi:probable phosphoglycerate mutase
MITRHTTTHWNTLKRTQGHSDLDFFNELNEQGEEEARQIGRQLLEQGITRIVSSDLKRAKQTAEIINQSLGVKLFFDPGLRECCFGELEGMTRDESVEKFGSAVSEQWSNFFEYDFSPFHGETRDQVFDRHLDVLKKNYAENGEKILLVGHGRGLWTLLAGLGYAPRLKVGDCRSIDFSLRAP